MIDVSLQARCSRAALYKQYATKDALLAALVHREVGRFLDVLRAGYPQRQRPGIFEDAFVFAVGYARGHPVVQGALAAEPDFALTLLEQVQGPVGTVLLDVTTELVRGLLDTGGLRRSDPRTIAEVLLRLLMSYVLAPALGGLRDDEAQTRRVVAQVVRGFGGEKK